MRQEWHASKFEVDVKLPINDHHTIHNSQVKKLRESNLEYAGSVQ